MKNPTYPKAPDTVSVSSNADEWDVSIQKTGVKAIVSFQVESHAHSFAAMQRARLVGSRHKPGETLEGEAGIIGACET